MHFRADDLSVDWFTSSYSNDQGGECVEAGRMRDGSMAVRDSKNPCGPAFVIPPPPGPSSSMPSRTTTSTTNLRHDERPFATKTRGNARRS
ncbi:DUF397 domain-containing protein [Streptomyces sp. G45]|uniref:DUF397 domain-containing protein n=1 Tax=Streptomyces sp. G45 TaxID=3406627 RepID=UPI003C2A8948